MKKNANRNAKKKPTAWKAARQPTLRFSPYAWAKLLYLRDRGDTEVGGFGIAPGDNVLCIEDVVLMRQQCTAVSVAFDDNSVADFFDRQVDAGRRPDQFARIWVHTHPGDCPRPSSVDEETFARVFGRSDWAVMFILAEGGQTYARLRFNTGPGGSLEIPVQVDFELPFPASDHVAWDDEYLANVAAEDTRLWGKRDDLPDVGSNGHLTADEDEQEWLDRWFDYVDQSQECRSGELIHER